MPPLHEITPSVLAYFQSIHGRIDGKHSEWPDYEEHENENFNAFDKALKKGQTLQEAVKETSAWSDAKRLGFTEYTTPKKNDKGNWTVDFYLPGTLAKLQSRRNPFL